MVWISIKGGMRLKITKLTLTILSMFCLYTFLFQTVGANGEVDSNASVGFYGEFVPPKTPEESDPIRPITPPPSKPTKPKEEGKVIIDEDTPTSQVGKELPLPQAGETSSIVYNILGSFLIAVGFFLLFFKKRKEKEENV